jgi:allantoinase
MYDLLITNGKIVKTDEVFNGHIAITNGKIAGFFDADTGLEAKKVIDAEGKIIFPGVIDCHVHFNDPGYTWREDFSHGTRSAVAGGVTTIVDMPLQNKPATVTQEVFESKKELVKEQAVIDYALWGGLVDNNLDQLKGLCDSGAAGIKSFLSPVSKDYSTTNLALAYEAMKVMGPSNIILGFHAEEFSVIAYNEEKAKKEGRLSIRDYLDARPVLAEILSIESMVRLARETGAKIHICHVSHPEAAEIIKKAKQEGIDITAETCTHYLVFNEEDFIKGGPKFKCAPPLRKEEDRKKLWDYVLDGTLSCIVSDHSPCALEEKTVGNDNIWEAWGGISGVQSTFQVMFNEVYHKYSYDLTLLSKTLAYEPAKIFGIGEKKGKLEIGYDADIIIVDPQKDWTITPESLLYKNKFSAFEGLSGKGLVEETIIRGESVFKVGGGVRVEGGFGQFVKAKA